MHVCVCVYDYRLGKMETKMFDQKFSLWNCMWPETLRLASSADPPNILPSIIHPQVYCCLLCFLPATIAGEGYMLCDSNSERHIYRDRIEISGCQGLAREG